MQPRTPKKNKVDQQIDEVDIAVRELTAVIYRLVMPLDLAMATNLIFQLEKRAEIYKNSLHRPPQIINDPEE